MTVRQSPAYDFIVSDGQKAVFLSPFRTVLSAIHMQVTDRPSPDAPSLTQAIIVQVVYSRIILSFFSKLYFVFVFFYIFVPLFRFNLEIFIRFFLSNVP